MVCRFGITQKRDCGLIWEEHVQNVSCGPGETNCKTIELTWEVDFDSDGGDSGGPIYMNQGSSSHVAYGTHIHSEVGYHAGHHGWYSPIDLGISEYASVSGKTYSLCITASC
jgi:hypothetical protein